MFAFDHILSSQRYFIHRVPKTATLISSSGLLYRPDSLSLLYRPSVLFVPQLLDNFDLCDPLYSPFERLPYLPLASPSPCAHFSSVSSIISSRKTSSNLSSKTPCIINYSSTIIRQYLACPKLLSSHSFRIHFLYNIPAKPPIFTSPKSN
jgi:hypothetical protein